MKPESRAAYLKRFALGFATVITFAVVMTLLGTFKDAIWGPWYWLFAMRGLPEVFESHPVISLIGTTICMALACLSRPTLILFLAWIVINHLGMILFIFVGGGG